MKFHCPHCNQRIEAGEELAGQVGECPSCSREFVVPGQATAFNESVPQDAGGAMAESRARPRRRQWLVAGLAIGVMIAAALGFFTWNRPPATARSVATPVTPIPPSAETTKRVDLPLSSPPAPLHPNSGASAKPALSPETVKAANPQPTPPTAAARRYTQIIAKEAEDFAWERLFKKRDHAFNFPVEFDFPPPGSYIRGVKIGDTDYVIFGNNSPGAPNAGGGVPRHNISKLLPIVDRPDIVPLVEPAESRKAFIRSLSDMSKEEREEMATSLSFRFNGYLSTSTDLTVTDRVVLKWLDKQHGKRWTKESNTIPSGGYKWSINSIGVLLQGADTFLIAFEAPIIDVDFQDLTKRLLIAFDVVPLNAGKDGIRIAADKMPGASFIVK